jgi:hypothetical protein
METRENTRPFGGDGAPDPPRQQERTSGGNGAAGDELEATEGTGDDLRERAATAWHETRETVLDHPLAFAIVGGGIATLLAYRRATHRPPPSGLSALASSAGARASEIGARATELGTRATEGARALATPLLESGVATRAWQRARRRLGEQPVLIGLAGLALAALVAGAAPGARRRPVPARRRSPRKRRR